MKKFCFDLLAATWEIEGRYYNSCSAKIFMGNIIEFFTLLREAAKKVLFLVAGPIREGGLNGRVPLRKK